MNTALYGQPAIALPLASIKTTVTLSRQSGPATIESRYFTGRLSELPAPMAGIGQLIHRLQVHFHDDGNWAMLITSQIPAERGMGSSAAAAIAIIRAFFDLYDAPLSRPGAKLGCRSTLI